MKNWKVAVAYVAGLVTLPLLGLLLAAFGLLQTQANLPPPRWEAAIAGMALRNSAARRAPHVQSPLPPTDENLLAGLKIYRNACSGCHGDANTNSDYGGSFYPNAPQFAKTPPHKPDWQLFWIVKNGVRYSGMSAWDRQWANDATLSDDHMWKAVLFLSQLEHLPPAVEKEWHKAAQ